VADFRAPLYLRLTDPPVHLRLTDPPAAVECPACFALVLAARLDDHKRASHG